ncbi:hypothetical protein KIN20_004492 [Parelaphostrongylus tenuis]|uniref:Uncharacterized protein n=1 Tax=Parelaphostrongylus tenuis TaxID=148309 RepID=A0AAD5MJV2_PARTN|nr:hypothetical protein KIN20_004492 [Parelaphostrongylus tenuis]
MTITTGGIVATQKLAHKTPTSMETRQASSTMWYHVVKPTTKGRQLGNFSE